MRLGTRKSRAPSGVARERIGVSISVSPRAVQAARSDCASWWRTIRRRCITGRRRSWMRYLRRLESSIWTSSSISNGGVVAEFSTRTSCATISTSPVARFGFTASASLRVTSPRTSSTHSARAACTFSCAAGCGVGLEHDLRDAGAVAEVDEDHAAVVAPLAHPAAEHDLASDVRRAHGSTEVRSAQITQWIESRQGRLRSARRFGARSLPRPRGPVKGPRRPDLSTPIATARSPSTRDRARAPWPGTWPCPRGRADARGSRRGAGRSTPPRRS